MKTAPRMPNPTKETRSIESSKGTVRARLKSLLFSFPKGHYYGNNPANYRPASE